VLVDWGSAERRLTGAVSVLTGDSNGAYPSGNSLLVRGAGETIVIDPSVTVVARGGVPAQVDAVVNSHSHEDHIAGNGLFASNARVHVHHEDLPGVASLDGLMDVYGLTALLARSSRSTSSTEFHFAPRPDAQGFGDGHVFDLGGVTVEAVHLPGHTRGHSGFRISGGVFFLSDIDLTGFGPYYGDAWSDLEDFEDSLQRVRQEEADWYVTFHHKGVIEGRDTFVQMVDDFAAVIDRRHARCSSSSPNPAPSTTWWPTGSSTDLTWSTCSPTTSSGAAPRCTSSACWRAAKHPRSNPAAIAPPDVSPRLPRSRASSRADNGCTADEILPDSRCGLAVRG
jgi:glyoxylase-like metal-dependent hydrolase (beta-lactamase superfamily II)